MASVKYDLKEIVRLDSSGSGEGPVTAFVVMVR
jgi:hypothetical protein